MGCPAGQSEENDRKHDRGKDQALLERPSPTAANVRKSYRTLSRRRAGNESDLGHCLSFREKSQRIGCAEEASLASHDVVLNAVHSN
jgi:hypothetical protein